MRRPIPCAILVCILSALSLGRIAASTLSTTSPDLASLVAGAERICEVEVLDAIPVMLEDGTIETRYSFATLTPIKGVMASIQEVRFPGGEVAGRGLVLPGMPDLQVGDRSFLFLSQASKHNQWRMPVGLAAGAVKVQPATVASGARVFRKGGVEGQVEVQDYDQFLAEVFAEVQRQG